MEKIQRIDIFASQETWIFSFENAFLYYVARFCQEPISLQVKSSSHVVDASIFQANECLWSSVWKND